MLTKKRFTLYVPDPSRKECTISFEGYEWGDLQQASESIIGQYGYKFALEIFGRVFVMTDGEAIRFGQHKLPFTMGIANSKQYSTWSLNEDGPKEHVRWLDDQEIVMEERGTR